MHDEEKREKGGVTRLQFFLAVFITSFAYYIFPGYLFPSLSAISVACFIWKKSILAQQLGSGLHGLGIGSFALDWNAVVSFLGNPIAAPGFAIINVLVGFFLFAYIIIPAAYYSNIFEAKKFPFFSSNNFDSTGQKYNISRVLMKNEFALDAEAYSNYSKLYLSSFFAFSYGLSFATLTATFSHAFIFYGKYVTVSSLSFSFLFQENNLQLFNFILFSFCTEKKKDDLGSLDENSRRVPEKSAGYPHQNHEKELSNSS